MQEKKHKVGEEKGCDWVLQTARTKDESGGAQLPTSRCCSKGLFLGEGEAAVFDSLGIEIGPIAVRILGS